MDFMMRYGCFSMTHNDSAMSSGGFETQKLSNYDFDDFNMVEIGLI